MESPDKHSGVRTSIYCGAQALAKAALSAEFVFGRLRAEASRSGPLVAGRLLHRLNEFRVGLC